MPSTVSISFSDVHAYNFNVADADIEGLPREEANQWLKKEFERLECETGNMMGKVLILDVILDVAKYGGEARFAEDGDWAKRFAQCCAVSLGRETIHVDVTNATVR